MSSSTEAGGSRRPPVAPVAAAVLAAVLAVAAAQVLVHSAILFDDSYITYRYARNLVEGLGLVWNPGQPTEGYTNFLLVVTLAPFIGAGLDPLLVARVLSLLSLLAIVLLLARHARREHGAPPLLALVAAAPFPLLANGIEVSMLGLETTLCALVLLFSLTRFLAFWRRGTPADLYLFFLGQFVAFLLRPEAFLLAGAVGLFVGFSLLRDWFAAGYRAPKEALRPRSWAVGFTACLALPMAAYLGWKLIHFGHLVPNAFYIKVADSALVSPIGLEAVVDYALRNKFLGSLAFLGLLISYRNRPAESVLVVLFAAVYAAFFATVDALNNQGNRFMYPLTPFVYLLALPVLVGGLRRLIELPTNGLAKAILASMALYFLAPTIVSDIGRAASVLTEGHRIDWNAMVYKRYLAGKRLAEFPGIRDITISVGDAGVIPYFTGSRTVDPVGLNDRYIATTRDLDALVKYLFDQDITLFMYPTMPDLAPLTFGHGPLGNHKGWVDHPHSRWDDYEYVGTMTFTGAGYIYHLLLKRDYPRFDELRGFLEERLVDVRLEEFSVVLSGAEARSGKARVFPSDPGADAASTPAPEGTAP